MKNQITFLFIAFLSTVTAGNETVSRCNGTQTTIRQVLKTSLEDLIKQVTLLKVISSSHQLHKHVSQISNVPLDGTVS